MGTNVEQVARVTHAATGRVEMNKTIQHKIIILPAQLVDQRMKLLADEERGDGNARAEKKGEGVVVGEAEGVEHL